MEKNIILKGADAFSEKGFTQVLNAILRSKKLSMGAKMAYAALLSYAWQNDYCFPGQQRLGDDIGVTRQTANEYLQELKAKKFIKITRKGQGRPTQIRAGRPIYRRQASLRWLSSNRGLSGNKKIICKKIHQQQVVL